MITSTEDTSFRIGDNQPVSRVFARYVDPALPQVELVNYYGDPKMIPGFGDKDDTGQTTDSLPITVMYLKSSPEYALFPNGRMSVFPPVVVLVLLFPLLFFWLLWLRAKKRRRIYTLIAHGIIAEAEVVECKRTKVTVNGRQRYKAILRYGSIGNQASPEISVYGDEGEHVIKCKMKNKKVGVLYLPDRPEDVIPLLP